MLIMNGNQMKSMDIQAALPGSLPTSIAMLQLPYVEIIERNRYLSA